MVATRTRLRAGTLLACGTLVLHELRYLLVFGTSTRHELGREGHFYLSLLTPLVVIAVALALGSLLHQLADGRSSHARAERTWIALWAGFSAALLGLYSGQELLEGALSSGHPGGAAALLANRGAIAMPLALALGAMLAFVHQSTRAATRPGTEPAILRVRYAPVEHASSMLAPTLPLIAVANDLIARSLAGRAPPRQR